MPCLYKQYFRVPFLEPCRFNNQLVNLEAYLGAAYWTQKPASALAVLPAPSHMVWYGKVELSVCVILYPVSVVLPERDGTCDGVLFSWRLTLL